MSLDYISTFLNMNMRLVRKEGPCKPDKCAVLTMVICTNIKLTIASIHADIDGSTS